MIQILFAFLGGVLTIAAPCILPLLPILLGASVGQESKQRPFLIVLGFIASFALASLLLSFLVQHTGLGSNTLRTIAVICLAVFAVFMIWPKPFELLTGYFSGAINTAGQVGKQKGNMGGLLLGLVLGIVWTPCAGPVLASILVLIATQGSSGRSLVLVIAYAIGAGLPMLVIAYGSQYITAKVRWLTKYSVRLQQIFGVLILLLAAAMYFQYDTVIENKLTAFFPQSTLENKLVGNQSQQTYNAAPLPIQSANVDSNMTNASEKIIFQNYGPAPEFTGISHWLNTPSTSSGPSGEPLTMASLKGKVVLVDFWTYSCINCIRTLPYVTKWYDTYKDKGFIVIGVHTPEFEFEKVTSNVQTAIQRFGIHYPVAQDNDYGTWQAYNNEYWPAEYLIDQKGNIVYTHFGEGEYDHTENAIRELLGLNSPVAAENGQDLSGVGSPEMYFEPARLQNLSPDQSASLTPQTYTLPSTLPLNAFALSGSWQFNQDHATLVKPDGAIRLHFASGKVFMVAASDKPVTLKITVDGKPQKDVTVQMSELYTLFDSTDYTEHIIDIQIPDAGFQAFTFTFG